MITKRITELLVKYKTEGFKTEEEEIAFFQELVDAGLPYDLEGALGAKALKYINEGKVSNTPKPKGIRWLLNLKNKGQKDPNQGE